MLARIKSSLTGRWLAAVNRWQRFVRSLYRDQHQLTSTTAANRYPELFAAVAALTSGSHPRVLSYGCSTGEECATLETRLDPKLLVGADINSANLKIARKKFSSPRLLFVPSEESHLRRHAPFDIIFALSVLCRWEETQDVEDSSDIYPFEKFESAVELLNHLLTPGGLLVMYNSNFRFEDSQTFAAFKYEVVPSPDVTDSGFVHKFDRRNKRVRETHRGCIYRKGTRT